MAMPGSILMLEGLGYLNEQKAYSKEIKPEIVTVGGWVLLSTDR
jgi:hypothetical protein